ncbi:MAG: hypothetical protein M1822_008587 [Bathelium mastoideum]|nr:MAG: hypothetical protein M1822_008587 [Bathelium mastoideum]
MPTIPIHPPTSTTPLATTNPLPPLLHTPSGLALLEIQGTIHFPSPNAPSSPTHSSSSPSSSSSSHTPIGRLVFPDYVPSDPSSDAWMRRVYLYVGAHQRLTGEVKKLGTPLGVLKRRRQRDEAGGEEMEVEKDGQGGEEGEGGMEREELEIVDVVRWKVLFASRPEPVGE